MDNNIRFIVLDEGCKTILGKKQLKFGAQREYDYGIWIVWMQTITVFRAIQFSGA